MEEGGGICSFHTLRPPPPHPPPLFTILCWKDEEGQTNFGVHGVMQGHCQSQICLSLEESKVYDRV